MTILGWPLLLCGMLRRKYLTYGTLLLIAFLSLHLISCRENSEYTPDVSSVSADFKLIRFDKEFMKIDTNNFNRELRDLISKYPEFSDIYFKHVLEIVNNGDTLEFFSSIHREILQAPPFRAIHDSIQRIYGEDDFLRYEFENAFKYLKYYFPDYPLPNIYTFQSDFALQKFIFSDKEADGIGIGLDMYLGSTFPYKALDPQNPAFSDYLTRAFNKSHIIKHSMELVCEELLGEAPGVRLIDHMIHNGIKIFFLKKFLPQTPDTIIFEYSADQLNWCKENELEMWAFFLDEGLIYETNLSKINKYINPSPSSPGMPKRAPGRTANYLGYLIVRSYVSKNPGMQLKDLMEVKDAQKFLEKSGFKPKRRRR